MVRKRIPAVDWTQGEKITVLVLVNEQHVWRDQFETPMKIRAVPFCEKFSVACVRSKSCLGYKSFSNPRSD